MSRREFDETGELCSREYRSGFTFDLPRNDATPLIEAPPVPNAVNFYRICSPIGDDPVGHKVQEAVLSLHDEVSLSALQVVTADAPQADIRLPRA